MNSPVITVWASICFIHLIGPYFFEVTVIGKSYLTSLFLEFHILLKFGFQQDAAPSFCKISSRKTGLWCFRKMDREKGCSRVAPSQSRFVTAWLLCVGNSQRICVLKSEKSIVDAFTRLNSLTLISSQMGGAISNFSFFQLNFFYFWDFFWYIM